MMCMLIIIVGGVIKLTHYKDMLKSVQRFCIRSRGIVIRLFCGNLISILKVYFLA